mmetsp:Transcript_49873/g.129904  ORF Transcript_49873/g.129904 Transcript_49873/m.129904 type:complete len:218 (+) Transcript_49873:78-731(+)
MMCAPLGWRTRVSAPSNRLMGHCSHATHAARDAPAHRHAKAAKGAHEIVASVVGWRLDQHVHEETRRIDHDHHRSVVPRELSQAKRRGVVRADDEECSVRRLQKEELEKVGTIRESGERQPERRSEQGPQASRPPVDHLHEDSSTAHAKGRWATKEEHVLKRSLPRVVQPPPERPVAQRTVAAIGEAERQVVAFVAGEGGEAEPEGKQYGRSNPRPI